MLWNKLKRIGFEELKEGDYEEFREENFRINLDRGKRSAIVFIFIELILSIMSIFSVELQYNEGFTSYRVMYILIVASLTIHLILFDKVQRKTQVKNICKTFLECSFLTNLLIWSVGIAFLDRANDGNAVIYIAGIILIAVTPYVEPIKLLGIYLLSQFLFISGIEVLGKYGNEFSDIINTTTIMFFSWNLSIIFFRNRVKDFNNKKLVERKHLELKNVNVELERLYCMDPLTKIYNRHKFEEVFKLSLESCKNNTVPISLMIMDVDYFKQYNDTYGHVKGDECLIEIAQIINEIAESKEYMAARFGGEEFVILMPMSDEEASFEFAENTRKKIEEKQIEHKSSKVSSYVTVSIGVYTATDPHDLELQNFVDYADKALYEAKKQGRNKVKLNKNTPF